MLKYLAQQNPTSAVLYEIFEVSRTATQCFFQFDNIVFYDVYLAFDVIRFQHQLWVN